MKINWKFIFKKFVTILCEITLLFLFMFGCGLLGIVATDIYNDIPDVITPMWVMALVSFVMTIFLYIPDIKEKITKPIAEKGQAHE